ncbi:MAG TPA: hypothetical protein VMB50_05210 [Myxococcales bacterium]|nr:hypothetical protein [Myxococcales bacterium]
MRWKPAVVACFALVLAGCRSGALIVTCPVPCAHGFSCVDGSCVAFLGDGTSSSSSGSTSSGELTGTSDSTGSSGGAGSSAGSTGSGSTTASSTASSSSGGSTAAGTSTGSISSSGGSTGAGMTSSGGSTGAIASTGTGSSGTTGSSAGSQCTVSTLAGNGVRGYADGDAGTAEFYYVFGLAVDGAGNVYASNMGNTGVVNGIRKVDPQGNVTTPALGLPAYVAAQALAIDHAGNLYVADDTNYCVWKVAPDGGGATVLAGNGTQGFQDGSGGPQGSAEFRLPYGLAVDGQGDVYLADIKNNVIFEIDPAGNVTTFSGNGNYGFSPGTGGPSGSAEYNSPASIAVGGAGQIIVGDQDESCLCALDGAGDMTVLAGNGTYGFVDGPGGVNGTAEFSRPEGVAADSAGNVYVADTYNNCIRKVDPSGNVTTLAGDGTAGFADGPGNVAEFDGPWGIAVDDAGVIYVADVDNARIRKVVCP